MPQVRMAPKIIGGLLLAGVVGYFGYKYLPKTAPAPQPVEQVQQAPQQQPNPAQTAATAVQDAANAAKAAEASGAKPPEQYLHKAPRQKDALDALIHEAGKK